MNVVILPRSVVMPWLRPKKNFAYWCDRLALIGFSLSVHLFLLDKGIWWDDVWNFIVVDIMSKENGYIYSFQVILSAIIAFISAFIAYAAAHYNERKNSFVSVNNVIRGTNAIRGQLTYAVQNIADKDAHNMDFFCQQLRAFSNNIKNYTNFFEDSDICYKLRKEVVYDVTTFITILNILAGELETPEIYIDNNSGRFQQSYIDEIIKEEQQLNKQFVAMQKYLDQEFFDNYI